MEPTEKLLKPQLSLSDKLRIFSLYRESKVVTVMTPRLLLPDF